MKHLLALKESEVKLSAVYAYYTWKEQILRYE